jgi:hypothetical protein
VAVHTGQRPALGRLGNGLISDFPKDQAMKKILSALLVSTLASIILCAATAHAQSAAAPAPVRLRGTVEKVEGNQLTVKERSGEVITLALPEKYTFQEVLPIDIAAIEPKAFVGTAAVPRADGTLEALEVVVFPESARGSGEGHYPWDLKPDSSMTNATVADLVRSGNGRQLTLRYKDGEKTVHVPDNVPVVTFKPGEAALVKPGARVFIVASLVGGQPTVNRLVVGRNGFAPPM